MEKRLQGARHGVSSSRKNRLRAEKVWSGSANPAEIQREVRATELGRAGEGAKPPVG